MIDTSYTYFTVMGSDMRTALGGGNLSLVAGGLIKHTFQYGPGPYSTGV